MGSNVNRHLASVTCRPRCRSGGAVTRSEQINLRVTAAEKRELEEAAESAGMPVSEWARVILRHAAGHNIALSEQMGRAEQAAAGAVTATWGAPKKRSRR